MSRNEQASGLTRWGWGYGHGAQAPGRLRAVCRSPGGYCSSPHPRGTYTLPPIHRAYAAEGVPIVGAGLQASLRRDARR